MRAATCDDLTMTGKAAVRLLIVTLGVLQGAVTLAAADRDSLVAAWAEAMAGMPGTETFEARDDGRYYLADESLPYEGEVRIVSSLVRPADVMTESSDFTHTGMVEFELIDLPQERRENQSYYYWLSDRQSLYYSADADAWLSPADYRVALQESYGPPPSFGPLSFMLNYGIWAFLLLLLAWVFLTLNKHQRKAKNMMDETVAINEMARENIERSAEIQQESIEITRKVLEIQQTNQRLLEQIRDNTGR